MQAGAAVSVSSDIRYWTRGWGGQQEGVYLLLYIYKFEKNSVMFVSEHKFAKLSSRKIENFNLNQIES